jgi:hypothetical protein
MPNHPAGSSQRIPETTVTAHHNKHHPSTRLLSHSQTPIQRSGSPNSFSSATDLKGWNWEDSFAAATIDLKAQAALPGQGMGIGMAVNVRREVHMLAERRSAASLQEFDFGPLVVGREEESEREPLTEQDAKREA